MQPRLRAEIWVAAALRLADLAGRPGVVLRRGDADAGGILAVLHGRAGVVVLSQTRDAAGELAWRRGTGAVPVTQDLADTYVARQSRVDPDLWVVEFETPDLITPFPATILE